MVDLVLLREAQLGASTFTAHAAMREADKHRDLAHAAQDRAIAALAFWNGLVTSNAGLGSEVAGLAARGVTALYAEYSDADRSACSAETAAAAAIQACATDRAYRDVAIELRDELARASRKQGDEQLLSELVDGQLARRRA